MKIINIEKLNENYIIVDGNRLYPVRVYIRKWYGLIYHFDAYPTNLATGNHKDEIIFYHYVNSLGDELKHKISEQINNFLNISNLQNENN